MILHKNNIKKFLSDSNIQEHIDSLSQKYQNKTIILYGAGILCEYILENYDLSRWNIIGIADKKYSIKKEDFCYNFKAINPQDIPRYKPDVIILTLLEINKVLPFLQSSYKFPFDNILPDQLIDQMIEKSYEIDSVPLPTAISISITSLCNLRCSMCPYHGKEEQYHAQDKPEFVSFDSFKNIVDQIDFECVIYLAGRGEALIHPNFLEFCHYLNSKGIKFSFTTNGLLFNEELQKELVNFEYLEKIIVSIDSMEKEKLEKMRRGINYEKLISNINNFIKINKFNIDFGLNVILNSENEAEVDNFIEHWISDVSFIRFINELESSNNFISYKYNWLSKRTPCEILFSTMIIANNGDVIPCCRDYFSQMNMGNVHKKNLKEIWFGQKYHNLRKLHIEKKWDDHFICKDCPFWMECVKEKIEIDKQKGLSISILPFTKIVRSFQP